MKQNGRPKKVTAEMEKRVGMPAPGGKIYVGLRIMTLEAAREIVRYHEASQKYADTHDDGSDESWTEIE